MTGLIPFTKKRAEKKYVIYLSSFSFLKVCHVLLGTAKEMQSMILSQCCRITDSGQICGECGIAESLLQPLCVHLKPR